MTTGGYQTSAQRDRTLLPVISGMALAAAFPPFSFYPIITVALLPLLFSAHGAGWRAGFRAGFITGLTFFAMLIWWIAPAISVYGKMPWFAAWPAMALLACYLACFYGIWAGIWGAITPTAGHSFTHDMLFPSLSMAGISVVLEWLRGEAILGGFPWGMPAYALAPVPEMIQSAAVWGVYGISFSIVFINICLFYIFFPPANRRKKLFRTGALTMAVIVASLNYCCGMLPNHNRNSSGKIAAAALQGAFPQDIKWNREVRELTLDRYERLGKDILKTLPDKSAMPRLLVWPETALPFCLQEKGTWRDRMLSMVKGLGAATMAGSQAYIREKDGNILYLNSAYMIAPEGRVTSRYDKEHLVPFGEYLPFEKYIGWARKYMPTAGNFSSGRNHLPLTYGKIRAGVQICFESIFPEISRRAVNHGANILTVITNDAWFGKTGAPYQHADMAVFRAVETGRWLIRAANTGVSAIISPRGRTVEKTEIFEPAATGHVVELKEGRTFYVEHGDNWIIVLCLCLAALQFPRFLKAVRTP